MLQNMVLAAPEALAQKLWSPPEHRLMKIFGWVLAINVSIGVSLYFIEPSPEPFDFFGRISPEKTIKLVTWVKPLPPKQNSAHGPVTTRSPRPANTNASVNPGRHQSAGGASGSGNIKDKINSIGVIGLLQGKSSRASDVEAISSRLLDGMMTQDIDYVIKNTIGLKTTGTPGTGRRGMAHIGYETGNGFGSMSGNGTGTLDELINALDGGGAGSWQLSRRGQVTLSRNEVQVSEDYAGERDQDEIRAVVMDHLGGIKHAYNSLLKLYPALKGKVTVAFTISAAGTVIKVEILDNTTGSPELEEKIADKIRGWRFRPIAQGTARVVYPFVFAPGE
jgi:TonB family protein